MAVSSQLLKKIAGLNALNLLYIKLEDLLKLTFCAHHITVTNKNKRMEYFNL